MALKLNSLAAGAMALNSTEYNAIIYWHDASTLAGSSYIAAFTDAGFMWTDAWNGGSPVWNYGFTSDGDALFRYLSVKGLHADWITSGTMSAERIDVDSLVVKKIANVTTSPTSWVTMGELTLGSVLYRGIFLYSTLYSSTDPAFMITASGSDGDFTLWDRNDVPRMSVGSGADDGWAYWDKFGVSRFSIGNWGGAYFWSAFGVGETLHTGTLLPVEPSVSDIGSSNYKWKDGFFSGEIYARYLELAAHDSTNEGGELKLLGAGIYEDIIIDTFKGTFRVHNGSIPYLVVTGSNIRPEINNAHDLGSSTQAWKDAYLSGTIYSNVPTNELKNIIYGQMATNDFYRIRAGGLSDSGYLEIATADGGNEPIYIRQYTGTFTTIARSLTLLDASGNSVFPGTVYVSGGQPVWHAGNMIYATGALTYGSWYTSPNPAVIETIQWTRIGGMVFLGGAFYRGNANEAVLTILPAEVRPPKKIVFGASPIEPYSDRAVIEVNTDGTVACTFYNLSSGNYATKSFSLNGICYRL
jgi:hypothetical protein